MTLPVPYAVALMTFLALTWFAAGLALGHKIGRTREQERTARHD